MTLQLTRKALCVAGHEIQIELPACQNQLLEDALHGEGSGSSDCDPYWGTLWETAPRTAAMILQHQWSSPLKTLELGCGIGVTGIAALIAGHNVTFSDRASAAVDLAVSNAALNGFSDSIGIVFDWQNPPANTYDFIFSSDILYDVAQHGPLLTTLHSMLNRDGLIWIGDPGRENSLRFSELAVALGWCVEVLDECAQPSPNPPHTTFRLMSIRRRDELEHVPDSMSTGEEQ